MGNALSPFDEINDRDDIQILLRSCLRKEAVGQPSNTEAQQQNVKKGRTETKQQQQQKTEKEHLPTQPVQLIDVSNDNQVQQKATAKGKKKLTATLNQPPEIADVTREVPARGNENNSKEAPRERDDDQGSLFKIDDVQKQNEKDDVLDEFFREEEYAVSEDDDNLWSEYVDTGLEDFDVVSLENVSEHGTNREGQSVDYIQQVEDGANQEIGAVRSSGAAQPEVAQSEFVQPEVETEATAVCNMPGTRKRKHSTAQVTEDFELFVGEDMNYNEASDGSQNSDSMYNTSESSSDEDGSRGQRRTFEKYLPVQGLNDPQFKVGLIFSTKIELKDAITQHGIKWGRPVRFEKNDNARIKAICGGTNCNWMLYAAKMTDTYSFQIRSIQPKHKCGRTFYHKGASYKWLARNYLEDFKSNKTFEAGKFQEKIHKELNVNISRNVVYKAKGAARLLIEGKYRDQYKKLQDYCEELRIKNPNSTVILETYDDEDTFEPVFRRLYVCFGAVRKGFMEGCRKIIGLDGCFLKGPHPGILLSAVGIDANNGFYPIAYCVDACENKENWKWFLEILIEDLNIYDQENWAFISDRQKGLIPAVGELLPRVEHRFCVRHLHNNFKKEHPGEALKIMLWNCAKSTYENKFKSEFEALKEFDEQAYMWLAENDTPRHWSRAFFRSNTKCDVLLNNHCESFNSNLLEAREKPILGMLERIRVYIMTRLKKRKDWIMKHDSEICPRILKHLEKLKEESRFQAACFAGEKICQVTHSSTQEQFVVDLAARVCSCRKWELSGIPCVHAIAAIGFIGKDPADFVHYCYTKEAFLKAYTPIINPINGPNNWPRTDKPTIIPPPKLKLPGRPKKARIREQGEPAARTNGMTKMSKKGLGTGKCRKCGKKGHNKRTCPTNATSNNHSEVQEHENEQHEMAEVGNDTATPKGDGAGTVTVDLSSFNKCSLCGEVGHNRRSCQQTKQQTSQGTEGATSEIHNTQATTVSEVIATAEILPTQNSQVGSRHEHGTARKQMKCSLCKQIGHNKKRCPSAQGQSIKKFKEYLLRGSKSG